MQAVGLHEQVVGRSGDRKTVGHVHLESVFNITEIGHLAADQVGHAAVHRFQGDDQPLVGVLFFGGQLGIDPLLNGDKTVLEGAVFSGRNVLHGIDHPEHIDRYRGAVCLDKRHAEGLVAL